MLGYPNIYKHNHPTTKRSNLGMPKKVVELKRKLSELKPGEEGKIIEIRSSLRAEVAGMGIRNGKKVKVSSEQPAGGPIVIEIEGNRSSLGRKLAESVTVEIEE